MAIFNFSILIISLLLVKEHTRIDISCQYLSGKSRGCEHGAIIRCRLRVDFFH